MKKIFSSILEYVLHQAAKPAAVYFLFIWSFVEAWFIIPIPPDVILAPMTLAKPSKAFFYANITTISSILGGCVGFIIGMFAIDYAMGVINTLNLQGYYDQALEWFSVWGSAVILIAGFTIIPFKVFTIMAGAMKMNFFLFLLAATLSRGARFHLVSYAAKIGGEKGMDAIVKYIDKIGYLIILIFIVILFVSY